MSEQLVDRIPFAKAAWVLLAVTSRMGKKVSQPQKFFDDEDDTKLDKRE
jgi:hypothetical protein